MVLPFLGATCLFALGCMYLFHRTERQPIYPEVNAIISVGPWLTPFAYLGSVLAPHMQMTPMQGLFIFLFSWLGITLAAAGVAAAAGIMTERAS